MSYAVKIGTVEAEWVGDNPIKPGFVKFEGDFPGLPIWDNQINNVRQMNAQEIAALPAQAIVANRALLVSYLSNGPQYARLLRGAVLAFIDLANSQNAAVNAMLSAVAAASSLAELKTRFSSIQALPSITKQNVIASITSHINAGDVDS